MCLLGVASQGVLVTYHYASLALCLWASLLYQPKGPLCIAHGTFFCLACHIFFDEHLTAHVLFFVFSAQS